MDLEHKKQFIQQLALFHDLSDAALTALALAMHEHHFPAHTVFIEQNDEPNVAYIVYQGGARVYRMNEDGEEITIALLGPGEIVGEMALIDNAPRSAYVETIQDSTMLVLSKTDFQHHLFSYPQTAINLLRILAVRLRETGQEIEERYSNQLIDRTWNVLKTLENYFPKGDIVLSHEELAAIIGATRARVTKALNTLQANGKISLSHRNIHLR